GVPAAREAARDPDGARGQGEFFLGFARRRFVRGIPPGGDASPSAIDQAEHARDQRRRSAAHHARAVSEEAGTNLSRAKFRSPQNKGGSRDTSRGTKSARKARERPVAFRAGKATKNRRRV